MPLILDSKIFPKERISEPSSKLIRLTPMIKPNKHSTTTIPITTPITLICLSYLIFFSPSPCTVCTYSPVNRCPISPYIVYMYIYVYICLYNNNNNNDNNPLFQTHSTMKTYIHGPYNLKSA